MRTSLSRRFLIGLGVTSLAFTLLASVAAFAVFQRDLESRQISFLTQYVRERTDNVDRRFSNLITLHHSAVEALSARLASLTPTEADGIINQATVRLPDGTRRSRDDTFTGHIDHEGGRIYGMAAFLPKPDKMTADERIALAGAFPIVSSFGQAAHGDYDNFYFFTPQNRLIMFGPDRPDKLMFYRHDAPADLDFSKEEMNQFVSPTADPTAESRCTSLQRLLQDELGAQRVATACITPAYVRGRYVGAFGSSIKLTSFLNQVVDNGLQGADTLIMRQDGELIAAPRAARATVRSEEAVAAYGFRPYCTATAAMLAHLRFCRAGLNRTVPAGSKSSINSKGLRLSSPRLPWRE